MLFIVIHQVYELWFKQVLHELGRLEQGFAAGDTAAVLGTFKRILTILKTLVAQVDVLETMTPFEFGSFRARLESASGFQSLQFRADRGAAGQARSAHAGLPRPARRRRRGEAAAGAGTGRAPLYTALPAVPGRAGRRGWATIPRPALIDIYRHHPALAAVCERMVDLDEGLQEWRYRHVKMVERTIGIKRGTGGSAGAEYLRTTLSSRCSPICGPSAASCEPVHTLASLRRRPNPWRPTTAASGWPSGCC